MDEAEQHRRISGLRRPSLAAYDFLDRQYGKLEPSLTHCKQTLATISRRQWFAISAFRPVRNSADPSTHRLEAPEWESTVGHSSASELSR